jgi:hypothetical protein
MTETITALIWAVTALIVTATVTLAALKGWRGWLDYKRFERAQEWQSRPDCAGDADFGGLIEMADVRERLRKLEAIATGVDL